MNAKEGRNTWAIGILAIIGLGIVLIIASIIISSSQSIDVDTPFDNKRKVIDKTFNEVAVLQNDFENHFESYIGINEIPKQDKQSLLTSPYYNASIPKDLPPKKQRLGKDGVLYIRFVPKDSIKDMKIDEIRLRVERLIKGHKDITKINIPIKLDSEYVYKSEPFSLPDDGYYQANFAINFTKADSTIGAAYFSKWLFNEK